MLEWCGVVSVGSVSNPCVECEDDILKYLCNEETPRSMEAKVDARDTGMTHKILECVPFCFCLHRPKSAITEIACGLFQPTAGESATVTHRLGSECLSVVVALSFCDHENSIVQMGDSSPQCAAVTLVSLVPAL